VYLGGEEIWEGSSQYSLEDRRDALEILANTKAGFVSYVGLAEER
jgi:hypothetical protein